MGVSDGSLDVFDVSAQTFMDDGEGQLVPRNILKGNEFNLQAFGTWFKVQILKMGPVYHIHLRDMWKAEEAKEGMYADVGVGLFYGFSCGGFFCAFPQFHESCWEGPESYAGFDGTAAEEDLAFPLRDGAGHNFRVLVVNGVTCRADSTEECFPFGNFLLHAGSAFTAKIDGGEHVFLGVLGKMRPNISLWL